MNRPCDASADYYELHADEYASWTVGLDMNKVYERFCQEISPGAHIVDAGCGSGRDTKVFLQRGYRVTAFDASPLMARVASKYTGQECSVLRFQDIHFKQEFDAVWACASLLHVPKREMKEVFLRLWAALKPGGLMYASFIEGDDERVSEDGRLYNSYTAQSLRALLKQIPQIGKITFWHSDEASGSVRRAPWLNCLLKK